MHERATSLKLFNVFVFCSVDKTVPVISPTIGQLVPITPFYNYDATLDLSKSSSYKIMKNVVQPN